MNTSTPSMKLITLRILTIIVLGIANLIASPTLAQTTFWHKYPFLEQQFDSLPKWDIALNTICDRPLTAVNHQKVTLLDYTELQEIQNVQDAKKQIALGFAEFYGTEITNIEGLDEFVTDALAAGGKITQLCWTSDIRSFYSIGIVVDDKLVYDNIGYFLLGDVTVTTTGPTGTTTVTYSYD